jgi:hypothetical protein
MYLYMLGSERVGLHEAGCFGAGDSSLPIGRGSQLGGRSLRVFKWRRPTYARSERWSSGSCLYKTRPAHCCNVVELYGSLAITL